MENLIMELVLVLLTSMLLLITSYFSFKGTILDFNPGRGLIWSSLYYKTIFFILIPLILVQLYPLSELTNNPPDTSKVRINEITVYSISAVFIFTIVASFILRWSKLARKSSTSAIDSYSVRVSIRFGWITVFVGLVTIFFGIVFLGHEHALITTITTGENLKAARMVNKYESGLPSQISAFFPLAYKIAAISGGIALGAKKKYTSSMFLICSLFIATIVGSKAPLATAVIFFTLSYLIVCPPRMAPKTMFWYLFMYPLAIVSAVYFMTSYQIPNLDLPTFVSFIFRRLGFGQMGGTFNTFTFQPFEGQYYWHMVPFASIFVDYPVYQKDLMLSVMQVDYANTGIQNSLFISEAYGVGGWALASLSPVIVGSSYAFGFLVFYMYLRLGFNDSIGKLYGVPIYISTMNLTGGFSGFPLLKSTILLMLLLVPVMILWKIFYGFGRKFPISRLVGNGTTGKSH